MGVTPAHNAADRIDRPEDLNLPPEAAEVFAHLTAEGAERFSREIMDALIKAQMKGNLRPVRDVVEAWYRSLKLVQLESHTTAVAEVRTSNVGDGVSLSDIADAR